MAYAYPTNVDCEECGKKLVWSQADGIYCEEACGNPEGGLANS